MVNVRQPKIVALNDNRMWRLVAVHSQDVDGYHLQRWMIVAHDDLPQWHTWEYLPRAQAVALMVMVGGWHPCGLEGADLFKDVVDTYRMVTQIQQATAFMANDVPMMAQDGGSDGQ